MLSKNLEMIRRMWGLNQKDLAAMLGVTQPMYQTYEKGTREPDTNFLIELEDLTGIPIKKLWRNEIGVKELPPKPIAKGYQFEDTSSVVEEEATIYNRINKIENDLKELKQVLATQ